MENKSEITRHVRDQDCPLCGFPEMVVTRELQTSRVFSIECSSKKCPWIAKIKSKKWK